MKLGPERRFHSKNDVEDYYKIVYYAVNKNKSVGVQDKLDVAHEVIRKLIRMDKEINVRYISQTVRSVIWNYVGGRIRDFKKKADYKESLKSDYYSNPDFSEFDWSQVPVTKEERKEIETLFSNKGSALAKERGVGKTAISMKKKRLIEKIRKRLAENSTFEYNE